MDDIRAKWNQRYREDSHRGRTPDPFLVEAFTAQVAPAFPDAGVALDIAGGRGRHAVWLAQQGWRVTMIDISEVGVAEALQEAAQGGTSIDAVAADSVEAEFGDQRYDLAIVFLYLERKIFPKIAAALRPGGMLVYKTYTRDHFRFAEAEEKSFFLERDELRSAFPQLDVIWYEEAEGAAKLIARKLAGG